MTCIPVPPGAGQVFVVVNPAGQLLDCYVEQAGMRIRLEPIAVERTAGTAGVRGSTTIKLDDRAVRWTEHATYSA